VRGLLFGSSQIIDENTVVMGIGKNRTLANLKENPHAVFIVMEPGKSLMDWKGVRVYLEVLAVETGGGFFDLVKDNIAKAAGKAAGDMIRAAIRFKIAEVRPIVDMGG
jgi:hypothetical protein